MKINDDHLYHGAVLTQIAEHPQFTAINSFRLNNEVSRSCFKINDEIGVYLKYASKPTSRYSEYPFTFNRKQLYEPEEVKTKCAKVFIALVCVKDRQICCLPYEDLKILINRRDYAQRAEEEQYVILATLPKNKSFRVYVNSPGAKGKILFNPLLIPRNVFPHKLFE